MPEPLAYLNGRILPISQAALPVFDLGVAMGVSVTELLRTFRHEIFRLPEHLERLFQSARAVGIELDHTPESLSDLATELVAQNARLIPPRHDLGVTIFATGGTSLTYTGMAGVATHRKPTVCVHTFPLPFELYAPRFDQGLHLVTPTIRQIPPETIDPRIKCRSRMHWFLADDEARRTDPQAMALLLDQSGQITETSTSNLFLIRQRKLLAPPESTVLGGISLQVVRELAGKLGLEFERCRLSLFDLYTADEAATCSTTYCLMPVTRCNRRQIGTGRMGPLTEQLLSAWSDLVGLDIDQQIRTGAAERMAAMETPES